LQESELGLAAKERKETQEEGNDPPISQIPQIGALVNYRFKAGE